jgi:dihydrodipicolinate synthase/N-acetylneuraminate lyase
VNRAFPSFTANSWSRGRPALDVDTRIGNSFRSWAFIYRLPQAAASFRIDFWREFAEIENVVAIKIASFNRYQTLDVIRAVAESERQIALYTGNDDNIVMDLLTPYAF